MALQMVARPNIRIALDDEQETWLIVTAIPGPAAAEILDQVQPSGLKFGTLAQTILKTCKWHVEGPVLDADGNDVSSPSVRQKAAEEAVLGNLTKATALVMDVLSYIGGVDPNWRTVSGLRAEAAPESGID